MEYLVTWKIEIEANNAQHAVKVVLKIMQDKDTRALCFEVSTKSTPTEYIYLDLLENIIRTSSNSNLYE